jgi:hypothetical protein
MPIPKVALKFLGIILRKRGVFHVKLHVRCILLLGFDHQRIFVLIHKDLI